MSGGSSVERLGAKPLVAFFTTAFGLAYALDIALIDLIRACRPEAVSIECLLVLPLGVARMYTVFAGVVVAGVVAGIGLRETLSVAGLRFVRLAYVVVGASVVYASYALGTLYAALMGIGLRNPVEGLPVFGESPVVGLIILLAVGLVAGVTVNLVAALGEEVGWRGLLYTVLVPRLGFYRAALVVGVFWGLWHAPLTLLAGYNYPHHPDPLGLAFFTMFTMSFGVVLFQLRALAGTILAPAAAHGTINAIAGLALDTYTVEDEIYTYPLGIAGILAFTTIAAALAPMVSRRLSSAAEPAQGDVEQ